MAEAVKLPEAQGKAYLSQKCLDKLNLSLTSDRWAEQQRQHGRAPIEPERER